MSQRPPPVGKVPAGGSLNCVGLGFLGVGHMTPEAVSCVRTADKLFYLGADGISRAWLESQNHTLESLYDAYAPGKNRLESYEEMICRMLAPVRDGREVCVAFYGHPGVFVYPSHEAIRRATAAGYAARMFPAISAEDCLLADLEIDPSDSGCASYEATDFLVRPRRFDTAVGLLLWQVGGIGVATYEKGLIWSREGVKVLTEFLMRHYEPGHEVIVYEAAVLPVCDPVILRVPLSELPATRVTVYSTLYVPPVMPAPIGEAELTGLGLA